MGADYQPLIQGEVTSTFGLRVHPVSGEVQPHRGLDLAVPEDAPFAAAHAGVVRFAGQFGEYGKLVVVEHYYDGRQPGLLRPLPQHQSPGRAEDGPGPGGYDWP